jgi:hypothetical protein
MQVVRTLKQLCRALEGTQMPVNESYVLQLIAQRILPASPGKEKDHYIVDANDIERVRKFIQYPKQ